MGRTRDILATGSFSLGQTGTTSLDRRPATEILEIWDAVVLPTGVLRPRPGLETLLQLGQPIEYLNAIPNEDGTWTLVLTTPTTLKIYTVDGRLQFTERQSLPRASQVATNAVGYAGDIFFTLDGNAFFYDPEGNTVYSLTLPAPQPPTLQSTTQQAPLKGRYSYRLTYVRQTIGRFPDEGPASDPASIESRGTAVTINLPTTPSGLGITAIRIYRAVVDGDVVRPYLLVAEVPPTTTSYTDTKSIADLGLALFTLGIEVKQGRCMTVFLDHLFVSDGDLVFISSPFRPTTFQPGFDLAMDEKAVPMGEINALIRMRDGVLVVKRDSLYRITPSGSERVPFLRGLISDALGSDSPYGATPLPGGDVLIATPTVLTTLSSEGQQNVLGPLVPIYRDIPEGARKKVFLHYAASRRWLFVLTSTRNFINTEGAWVSWKTPVVAATSLVKPGEDIILFGDTDGKLSVLKETADTSAFARVLIRTVPGSDLVARMVAFHVIGVGTVSARVLGKTISSGWKTMAVNSREPAEISSLLYARGDSLILEIIVSGSVSVSDFTLFGRPGRTR